jgi:hypothetical protein
MGVYRDIKIADPAFGNFIHKSKPQFQFLGVF